MEIFLLILLVTPFDTFVADTFCNTPSGTVLVGGSSGLLPLIMLLMRTEIAAIGGAERIEVRDGEECSASDEDDVDDRGGGGSDLMAVIWEVL